jgi:hypothetical protein
MLEASYQDSGDGYRAAEAPKHEVSSSVFSTPGLRATAAIPFGSSLASERVNPSTAHFEVQYADTCHPHIPSKKPRCTTHESLLLFHNLTQFSELLLKQISCESRKFHTHD